MAKRSANARMELNKQAYLLGVESYEDFYRDRKIVTAYDLHDAYRNNFRSTPMLPYNNQPYRFKAQFIEMARRVNMYNDIILKGKKVWSGPHYLIDLVEGGIMRMKIEYVFTEKGNSEKRTSTIQFNISLRSMHFLANDESPFPSTSTDSRIT